MKRSSILFFGVVLLLPLLLTGCGKTAAELTAEKIIENNLGGNADVNIKGDSVNIETDQGNWQAGQGASLPDNWPADIYVPEGNIITAINTGLNQGITVVVDKSVAELKDEYKEQMAGLGWNSTTEFSIDNSVILGAEKDGRLLSISIVSEDNQSTMVITWSQN